jgi:hypothetical protein
LGRCAWTRNLLSTQPLLHPFAKLRSKTLFACALSPLGSAIGTGSPSVSVYSFSAFHSNKPLFALWPTAAAMCKAFKETHNAHYTLVDHQGWKSSPSVSCQYTMLQEQWERMPRGHHQSLHSFFEDVVHGKEDGGKGLPDTASRSWCPCSAQKELHSRS